MYKEKSRYLQGTAEVLKRSQKNSKIHHIKILGMNFVVYPNVFSPKYFFDSEFFAKIIPVKEGEKFLEIGPGTGVVSIFVALNGASRVVSIDINSDAVRNTKKNVALNNVSKKVTVLKGDLYSPLKKDDKFDSIFWNVPFGYVKREKLSKLEMAVFDTKYSAIKRFITGAKTHLKVGGKLLIGFSTTLGHYTLLKNILKENGYSIKLLAKIRSKEKYPVSFELFEAKL